MAEFSSGSNGSYGGSVMVTAAVVMVGVLFLVGMMMVVELEEVKAMVVAGAGCCRWW